MIPEHLLGLLGAVIGGIVLVAVSARQRKPGPRESSLPSNVKVDRGAVWGWVDGFLRGVGIATPAKGGGTSEWREFGFSGLQARVGVVTVRGQDYLRVDVLMMELPSDRELLLPLYRELLERGYDLEATCRFGVDGTRVYACDVRRVDWLDAQEVGMAIDATVRVASAAVRGLAPRYGGAATVRGTEKTQ